MGQGWNFEEHAPQERFEKDELEFRTETAPENLRYNEMEINQEKCHKHRTNFENDEEGWNDRQYQRQQINQEE